MTPMMPVINSTLSILIVDDSTSKINRIKNFIESFTVNANIRIAYDQINAQKLLEEEKFDLLLLDMQLPNRYNESEPDIDGGQNVLEELAIGENYKQPSQIIAFTEFEQSHHNIRDNYPEIGAIQFDPSSDKWKNVLYRSLLSLSKSKINNKKIVYCEGNNSLLFNLIGLPGIEFWPLKDCRAIYFAAKNEKEKFSLRDRDFLTTEEIKTLTNKPYFENYIILDYYCFENYLFHPDNIEEAYFSFDKKGFKDEITRQKNKKFHSIIEDYKMARSGYTDFLDNDKKTMSVEPGLEIIEALKSDDFEVFYKFFDMAGKKDKGYRKSFDKSFLDQFNLDKEKLAQTKWFKDKFSTLLEKITLVN